MDKPSGETSTMHNFQARFSEKLETIKDMWTIPPPDIKRVALTYNINYAKKHIQSTEDFDFFIDRLQKEYAVKMINANFEVGKQGRLHCHYTILIHQDWLKPENLCKTFKGMYHPKYGKGFTFKAKEIFDEFGWETYVKKMQK